MSESNKSIYKKTKKILFNIKFLLKLTYRNLINWFIPSKSPLKEDIVEDSIHWVGHGTTIINLSGTIILTDPVLGSLGHFKRMVKPSLNLKSLNPNIILLSHGHMDHIDFISLLKLNKNSIVICPNGYKTLLKLFGYKNVIIGNWGDSLNFDDVDIKVLEANHDGRRFYLGKNYQSNSYLISKRDKSVFFAGDTAYTDKFNGLSCDLAIMPVGCYYPEGFDEMHCTPKQAFEMFKSMKSKYMVPIHYNTFILSLENNSDTLKTLNSLNDGSIKIIEIGQTVEI